jgi:hypothetical protein
MGCNKIITIMRKFLALLLFVGIVSARVNAHATTPASPTNMALVKSGNVFKLFYRGEQSRKVHVTIYNEKGKVVFREILRHTQNFMRPYNFSSLREGVYTIELTDTQGTRVEKVNHSFAIEKLAHLTRINTGENKYLLTVPNRGGNVLKVKIFNERNGLLYEKTEVIEGDFGKVYDLREIEGVPVFQVVDQQGRSIRLSKP